MNLKFLRFFFPMGCSLLIALTISHVQATPLDTNVSSENINSETKKQEATINQGFDFITLTPEKTLKLPKEGEQLTLQLGLRITNNSSKEKRFFHIGANSIFISENQKVPPFPSNCEYFRTVISSNDDFQLLKPNASLNFFYKAVLLRKQGEVSIQYYAPQGLICTSGPLKAGEYSIYLSYRGASDKWFKSSTWIHKESVWRGKVNANQSTLKLVDNF
jgi:hypothetical protein